MFLEIAIWTLFIASTIIWVLWVLTAPPPDKKIRTAPINEDAYTKSRFLPGKVLKDPDVIVIGSGMGGNTVSSILSRFGKKVLLLEHHDKLGGCTHTFSWSRANMDDDGFTTCEFDTGCHYTAVDMSMNTARSGALMKYITDGNAKWHDLGDPYDQVVFPHKEEVDEGCPNNDSYGFVCGRKRLISEIKKQINPNEPLVPERLSHFLTFCSKASTSIVQMYILRIFPNFMEPFLFWLSSSFYKYGKLTTAYVMSAMLEHGMTTEDVIAQKPLPQKPAIDLPNTWNRMKGECLYASHFCTKYTALI